MTTPSLSALKALVEQTQQRIIDLPLSSEDQVDAKAAKALTAQTLAAMIDHTLLKPEATLEQIQQLCNEAQMYGFASVCVHPTRIQECAKRLAGSAIKTCSVVGFPSGATLGNVKASETTAVVRLGAQEVDMVLNVGRLKDGDYRTVYSDVAGVVKAAHKHGALVKVILETGLLSETEKVAACVLVQAAGADFVKTATGFNGGGATVPDIRLMRCVVGPNMGVKAAGGVRTAEDAINMIAAGATRIGASAGVRIVQGFLGEAASKPLTAGETY